MNKSVSLTESNIGHPNYPEVKWVRPLGYALMVPLMFQMVNSKVHWWSDYPLGIYLGYTMARIVTDKRQVNRTAEPQTMPELGPLVLQRNVGAATALASLASGGLAALLAAGGCGGRRL